MAAGSPHGFEQARFELRRHRSQVEEHLSFLDPRDNRRIAVSQSPRPAGFGSMADRKRR
jgi:hypothetical protein